MNTRILSALLALFLLLSPFALIACDKADEITPPAGDGQTAEKEEEPKPNAAPDKLDTNGDGAVKILALGNSFSVNAFKYLHPILTAEGIENVTLGNLYRGGCDLKTTANFAKGGGTYPVYYKYDESGQRTEYSDYSLTRAITEEDWDVFTIQQVSGNSGVADSFDPWLDTIIECIRENRTVKRSHIMWHMTWAYEQDSTHADFAKYDSDQLTMYEAIVAATQEKITPNPHFDLIIPAATAIQNARTSSLGDTMTKDGYHLNDAACYIAGYTWYTSMTGEKIDEFDFIPEELNLSDTYLAVTKEAVNAVLDAPFSVTQIDL